METNRHTELRREKCRERNGMDEERRAEQNAVIFQKVTALPAYLDAEAILIYASYRSETDTFSIIGHALSQKKKVYCPRVEKDQLVFYRIRSKEDLRPGYRGIPEPEAGKERWLFSSQPARICKKELIIVPGTVFDGSGHRIGYGGGFYDRFLSRFKGADRPCFVGICFGCQMTEQIIPQAHDVDMDLVIHS